MKFTAREDIDAPIHVVYDHVSNFDRFERQMLRRGIDVRRDESCPAGVVGARWRARLDWRGKPYDVMAELASVEVDQGYAMELNGNGVVGLCVVDLVALSRTRTRMFVSADFSAQTFSAKLLLQSLRLGGRRLSDAFVTRVHRFARDIPTD